MHIRLGDRAKIARDVLKSERDHIIQLINVIAQEAEALDQLTPLFHIYSETELPCPSLEDGVFPEFPEWAIAPNEVTVSELRNCGFGMYENNVRVGHKTRYS